MPPPVSALFQISWHLHTTPDDDFDPTRTLELLRTSDMMEWPDMHLTSRPLPGPPLEALQVLTDFYLETHDAADLLGQCMAAEVDMFLDPTMCKQPVTLLAAEHARIACALWVLKIFHQLRSKFHLPNWDETRRFSNIFARNLNPWQIDQVISLERKFKLGNHPDHRLLKYAGQTDLGLAERLIETQYVKNYIGSIPWPPGPVGFRRFSSGIGYRQRHRPDQWTHTPSDVGHPTRALSLNSQLLRNYACICKEHLQPGAGMHPDTYWKLSRHLGLLFWDYIRLSRWQIADAGDLAAASRDDYQRGLSSEPEEGLSCLYKQLNANARTMERQIIKWTRCAGGETLEDHLYKKTVEYQIQQDKELMFITHGFSCSGCGLDGHWHDRCHPSS